MNSSALHVVQEPLCGLSRIVRSTRIDDATALKLCLISTENDLSPPVIPANSTFNLPLRSMGLQTVFQLHQITSMTQAPENAIGGSLRGLGRVVNSLKR